MQSDYVMTDSTKKAVSISLVIALGCLGGCCKELTALDIKKELDNSLHIGDSNEKIKQVLTKKGIAFSYDEFDKRYQSNIQGNGCTLGKSVIVYIYLDQSGLIKKIETLDAYSMP